MKWEQQCRIIHMCSRKYLTINTEGKVTLTADNQDPRTVFRLHAVIKVILSRILYYFHEKYFSCLWVLYLCHQTIRFVYFGIKKNCYCFSEWFILQIWFRDIHILQRQKRLHDIYGCLVCNQIDYEKT